MPCHDPRPEEGKANAAYKAQLNREWRLEAKIDTLTSMLCAMCGIAEDEELLESTFYPRTMGVKEWWEEHKKHDELRRNAAEAAKKAEEERERKELVTLRARVQELEAAHPDV